MISSREPYFKTLVYIKKVKGCLIILKGELHLYIFIGIIIFFFLLLYIKDTQKRRIKNTIDAEWREKRIFSPKENLASVGMYWKRQSEKEDYHGVDSITWRDLSMDDVFHQINYTQTSVGSEYLYDQLHNIQLSGQQSNESLYELMEKDKELRNYLLFELKRLGKRNYVNSSSYFHKEYQNFKHIWFYVLCSCLPIVSIIIAIISLKTGVLLLITTMIFNIIIYYRNKLKLDSNLYGTSYVASIIATGKRLMKFKDKSFQPYSKEIRSAIEPIRKFILFDKILALGKGTGDFEGIFEYIRIIFLLDYISYYYMIRMLQKYKKEYEKLWEIIGELDSSIAVVFYRHIIQGYCTPNFIEQEELVFDNMYHPLIKNPVKNSSHLNKTTLITGSNASGKSTYMKAVAVNSILAQTIHTVHSDSWIMKPSYIISSMAIQDNVIDGDSYFKAEIKSLKRIIQKIELNIPCLSFIDEILKGTNTVERIAASASIMNWLSKHQGMNLIASHDIELTTIAGDLYNNYHFHEIVQDDGVSFDYKIHSGPSTTKNAIKLLEVMEYPSPITELANALANEFEEKREWKLIK